MTSNQKTILACLTANVSRAKTRALRRFAQDQLDGYKARLALRERPVAQPRPVPTWDRPL